jgi:hypothetical protein
MRQGGNLTEFGRFFVKTEGNPSIPLRHFSARVQSPSRVSERHENFPCLDDNALYKLVFFHGGMIDFHDLHQVVAKIPIFQ